MRVLFVTHNVPRHEGDAAGSFVLRLAVALRDIGHQIDIIAPGAAGLNANDSVEGIAIERVRYGRDEQMTLAYSGTMAEEVKGSWAGRFALLRMLHATRRRAAKRVREAARSGTPYDVVHAHWWFPSALALWRLWPRNVPVLAITMHGSDVRLARDFNLALPLMRAVLGQAAIRTAVSRWLADAVLAIAPSLPVLVAPMPVDTRHFVPPEQDTPNAAARHGILFVGRLNEQKGLAMLLRALAHPELAHATVDVVGDGPDAATLRALAHSLNVDDRVRWHVAKSQRDLVPFYQHARCVAMPSINEGLGLVAVEAQLCGTPVVAFNSGGLPDVVRPSDGGTLVRANDVQGLATALATLLADPAHAARLGTTARAAMLSDFSPNAVAARYSALYRAALNHDGGNTGSRARDTNDSHVDPTARRRYAET